MWSTEKLTYDGMSLLRPSTTEQSILVELSKRAGPYGPVHLARPINFRAWALNIEPEF